MRKVLSNIVLVLSSPNLVVSFLVFSSIFISIFRTLRSYSLSLLPQLIEQTKKAVEYQNSLPPSGLPFFHPSIRRDSTDELYRDFRSNVLPLSALYALHLFVCRFGVKNVFGGSRRTQTLFTTVFSMGVMVYIHGSGFLFPLLYLLFQYFILVRMVVWSFGPRLRRVAATVSVTLTWILGIGLSMYRVLPREYHLRYEWIHPSLAKLDRFVGSGYHWTHPFMLSMMKNISFVWDFHQMRPKEKESDAEVDEPCQSLRQREKTSLPFSEYNFVNFMCYQNYLALYFSGPMIGFNAFVSFMISPCPRRICRRSAIFLGFRILFSFLLIECLIHYVYPVAILYQYDSFLDLSPGLAAAAAYAFCLHFYLKLNCIWKFGRFWALCDGLDPDEDLPRCPYSCLTLSEFWKRGFHISIHRWLLRYLYFPVGGSRRKLLGSFLTFVFVGVWHQFNSPSLWIWAVATVSLIFLEGAVISVFASLFPSTSGDTSIRSILQTMGYASSQLLGMIATLYAFLAYNLASPQSSGAVQAFGAFWSAVSSWKVIVIGYVFLGAGVVLIREIRKLTDSLTTES